MDENEFDAAVAAPEPAPPIESDPTVTPEHMAVWRWFNEHIANSPVSRSTEAVNHLMAKLPDLISSLEKKG